MNIFISYASEDRDVAEQIYLNLVHDGHHVFFDRADLHEGGQFDARIRKFIRRSNLFIFLISTDSISQSSYTLTELELVKGKWRHPTGRVLPVLIRETEHARIPVYLRSVTYLEPKGDVAAEVANAVANWPRMHRKLPYADVGVLLAFLIILGYWGWFWQGYCGRDERLLWGVLPMVFAVAWLLLRLSARMGISVDQLTRPIVSKLVTRGVSQRGAAVVTYSAVPLLLVLAWSYAAYRVYRLPSFPNNVTGIYVACFENDPGGGLQEKLIEHLNRVIKTKPLENVVVLALPRRLHDDEEAAARELGHAGQAALVLWGRISGPQRITSYLTVAKASSVLSTAAPVGGIHPEAELSKFYGLPPELETLQKVVAIFLEGYSAYHSLQFSKAARRFEEAQKDLSGAAGQEGLTPEKAMLASINFYLANSYYFQSKAEQNADAAREGRAKAVECYQTAITLTSAHGDPLFVEPYNNLGLVLLESGDSSKAVASLRQADAFCHKRQEDRELFCATAKHNLGNAYRNERRFGDALDMYQIAVAELERLDGSGPQERYAHQLAYLHQNLAYCRVKKAEGFANGDNKAYYDAATRDLDKALEYLNRSAGVDVEQRRYDNVLTRARISIIGRRWQDAIDLLEPLAGKIDNPNALLILSIAYDCRSSSSDREKSEASMQAYTDRVLAQNLAEWDEGQDYFNKVTGQCH